MVLVVVEAFGTVPKQLASYTALLDSSLSVKTIQKIVSLRVARIH